MIKAELFSGKDGRLVGFRVSGHSGTAARGEDIVCAGVSALVQSAALGIMEHLRRSVDCEDGDGKLSLRLREAPDELTEAVMKTMLLGLREIEKRYPKALRITGNER